MKKLWTLILVFISYGAFCQCDDIDKLQLGGTYSSKTHNYIPFEIKDLNLVESDSISYPNDIKKIEKYSDFIIPKAKEYIIARTNSGFYNRLKIYQVEVNYPTSTKIQNYLDEALYELSNFNVTYWIIYLYEKDSYNYAFGLEFNKDGELISENKFPDYSKNPDFENLTNPCDALNLVKADRRFNNKKIDFIEIAYLDEKNSFCWLIQEKNEVEKLGVSKYSVDKFYVSANINRIEEVKKETGSIIACGIEINVEKSKKKQSK